MYRYAQENHQISLLSGSHQEAYEIARRLFVINAFDGALTIMGVVIGAHFSGVTDAHIVITAGIARQRGHGHLRHQRCLSGGEGGEDGHAQESGRHPLCQSHRVCFRHCGSVDGISPALSAAFIVMPYFFVPQISMQSAFYTSLVLSLSILFTLGVFLARISDERPMASGIQMILVGIATIIIVGLVAQ